MSRFRHRCAALGLAAAVVVLAAPVAVATPVAPPVQQTRPMPDKSIAFYVGKNRTESGATLLGGFGHEPSSHWLEIVPRQQHEPGSTITVGATEEADLPGRLTQIPQVPETAKYITSNYSEFAGFPAPLTNGGLNEFQVAARDVWSDSRPELVEMTPPGQTGPHYSDLSRIAMERAHSAREAVEILGELIDEHGYTTYGGNSHLFADADEGWVFIEFAGGKGLWAAERLGPDDVRVSYPGYIGDFPLDYQDNPDYAGSPNLIDFAVEQGWWDPASGKPFNLQQVYGTPFPGHPGKSSPDDEAPWRHPPTLEEELRQLGRVSLVDMQRMVRDPRWSDDRSGYGQVAELKPDLPHPDLATLWVANTAAVTAPYIPFHIGAETVPPEYSQHRYLTSGAAANYLSPEYAAQEATRSATYLSKRLMYYTCDRPEVFLTDVTQALEGFEARIMAEIGDTERQAAEAYAAGDAQRARALLTDWSNGWAMEGVDLTEYLVEDVEARTKEQFGIRRPAVEPPPGVTAKAESLDMSLPEGSISARDRVHCDLGNGWAEGSTVDRKGQLGDPDAVPDYRAAARTDHSAPWLPIAVAAATGLVIGAGAVLLTRRRAG
ncbi:Dipeptidase [Saccharopolyspora kobensis]|uniref:Dipeptidase n=1 Tax=Saccharopolyspora kobensis TaxID=146035 RepID=A0A1H5TKJ9_9PSEU|nr:C69 family dipeptidase [Saccharopolyspora kobensis]SEF63310.1 Dipeptidase [Saccharopolyspora kobensis]SFC45240.1 Dipeptidase [Saccharopolyspora kobensis]